MDNKELKKLLDEFKAKMLEEVKELDFSTIYYDYDILDGIKEYQTLIDLADKDETIKAKIEKVEKSVLRTYSALKLTNEEGMGFYAKRGEPYDSEGNLIEDMYEDFLDNEDLFCDYMGDEIYSQMKKNTLAKLRSQYKDEY